MRPESLPVTHVENNYFVEALVGIVDIMADNEGFVGLIAAVGQNKVIGNGEQLAWKNKQDMAHFKNSTEGATVIMGRKTFESIGKPLPGRHNIVLTRDKDWVCDGVEVSDSLVEVLALRDSNEVIWVIGGGQVYQQAIASNLVDLIVITEIHEELEGDVFFPEFFGWREIERERHDGFDFVWLEK